MGGYCSILLGAEDTHGSYEFWRTSFIKYEGYFNDVDGPDAPPTLKSGYLFALDALDNYGVPGLVFTPFILIELFPTYDATFSVVPGKLDSNGSLMPCDIEAEGSGPCFNQRPWEIGLGARDLFNSFLGSDANTWISPVGSSSTSTCRIDDIYGSDFGYTYPTAFTGNARSSNNVKPPSYHTPPPLPHESTEFSLTLSDPSGQGWWNVIKFHPNQYILDDGENILHQGTLVDKAETTEKFSLKEGTYYLRFQGNHDVDAYDDTWTLATKDGVIATGGRYNRVTLTVGNGAALAQVEDVIPADISPTSALYPLANFNGLMDAKVFKEQNHKMFESIANSKSFQHLSQYSTLKDAVTTLGGSEPTLSAAITENPLATAGLVIASAFMGVAIMFGVQSFLRSNKKTYNPVLDISQANISNQGSFDIQLERSNKRVMQDCQL